MKGYWKTLTIYVYKTSFMFQSTSLKPLDLYVDLLMVLRKTKNSRNSFRGLTLNKDTFNGILSFICFFNFKIYSLITLGLNGSSSSSLSRRLDFEIYRINMFCSFLCNEISTVNCQ